jgi:hypothetical protein
VARKLERSEAVILFPFHIFIIFFHNLCSLFDSTTYDAQLSCVFGCHKAYALCTFSVNYFCCVIQMFNKIRKGDVKISLFLGIDV